MVRGDKTEWYPAWNRGAIVFNKDEDANKGTYLFVKYFLSPEVNAEWAQAMNALSPYGTTQAGEAYAAFAETMDPSLVAVQADLDIAGALPTVTGSYAVRNALKDAAIAVSGGMSAEDAMAECGLPVVFGLPYGHIASTMRLPFGVSARVVMQDERLVIRADNCPVPTEFPGAQQANAPLWWV